jgi:hypothetical protein
MADTLETYYASGAPYLSPSLVRAAQQILLGAAICVSILFLGNFIRMWVVGKRPNPVSWPCLAPASPSGGIAITA